MTTNFNHLRTYRKETPLILSDVACLLGLKDNTLLCKSEKGHRQPSLDMVLGYHILFVTPLLSYFDALRADLKKEMEQRIPPLIENLKGKFLSERANERVEYLQTLLTRLSNEK